MTKLLLAALVTLFAHSCQKEERKWVCGTVELKMISSLTYVAWVKVSVPESQTWVRIDVTAEEYPEIAVGSYYCGEISVWN